MLSSYQLLPMQLLDRQRLAAVVTALNAGGQSGLLATLMRGAVSALTGGAGGTTVAFAEALFSLISALVASSSGCSALASAGLVPAFLPMLDDHEPSHIHLVILLTFFCLHWLLGDAFIAPCS